MPSWHTPLDPQCPGVEHAFQIEVAPGEWIDDPMAAPVWDDLWEDFEKRHRATCERCQEYGAANVEVV
jgi:hypothetical protein